MDKTAAKKWLFYAGLPVLCAAFLLIKWNKLDPILLIMRELLVIFVYVASVWDLREKRIPNRLVAALLGVWMLVMIPQLFFRTEWALSFLVSGAIGFFLAGIVFLVVYVVSRKGLGGGDVKLMTVSGLYLGIDGVLPTMLYGSVLAALTGIVLIFLKRIGPKDAIPLVPFLYAGMLLTLLVR